MWLAHDLIVKAPQMVLNDIFEPMQSEYELQSVNTPTVSHDLTTTSHDPTNSSHDLTNSSHDQDRR